MLCQLTGCPAPPLLHQPARHPALPAWLPTAQAGPTHQEPLAAGLPGARHGEPPMPRPPSAQGRHPPPPEDARPYRLSRAGPWPWPTHHHEQSSSRSPGQSQRCRHRRERTAYQTPPQAQGGAAPTAWTQTGAHQIAPSQCVQWAGHSGAAPNPGR